MPPPRTADPSSPLTGRWSSTRHPALFARRRSGSRPGPGALFGILAEPADRPAADVAAVFLNAGAVRRIGPNRIWVETARRWATDGVPTIRLDLDGIGDSDGDADRYQDVAAFYVRDAAADEIRCGDGPASGSRVRAADHPRRAVRRWLLGFQGADRDERVTAALLLNPGALVWHDDLVRARDAARLRRLLRLAWWSRLLRGKVRRARIRSIASAAVRTPGRRDPGSTQLVRDPEPARRPRRRPRDRVQRRRAARAGADPRRPVRRRVALAGS